jgi:hypothetical protein
MSDLNTEGFSSAAINRVILIIWSMALQPIAADDTYYLGNLGAPSCLCATLLPPPPNDTYHDYL